MKIDLSNENIKNNSNIICIIQNLLNHINNNMHNKFNCLIIPMNIYNLIIDDDKFIRTYEDLNGIIKVGFINEFEVYLDLCCPPNKVRVSWDKISFRSVKIDDILNNIVESERWIKISF